MTSAGRCQPQTAVQAPVVAGQTTLLGSSRIPVVAPLVLVPLLVLVLVLVLVLQQQRVLVTMRCKDVDLWVPRACQLNLVEMAQLIGLCHDQHERQ